jgi:MoaA/NifB/PqqE/SkfB family radical SAM enzyme
MKKFKNISNAIFKKIENYLVRHYPVVSSALPSLVPLAINITTRCNFNCPHCLREPIDAGKTIIKDMTVKLFEKILRGVKRINYGEITLTGGEPILHPQFKKLIELVSRYGYYYTLVSNGWFYQEYWPVISQNNKLISISFSVDGATAEVHDRVRNKPGSFERVIKAIKFFKKKNIRQIGIQTCLTRQNKHQIPEIINLAKSLRVNKIKFLTPNGVLGEQDYFLNAQDREEVLHKLRQSMPILHQAKILGQIGSVLKLGTPQRINFCRVLARQHFAIDPEGGMVFCCDIYKLPAERPNILKDGLKKSFILTLHMVNEIKKQRLKDLWSKKRHSFDFYNCEYCNKHIEAVIKKLEGNIIS